MLGRRVLLLVAILLLSGAVTAALAPPRTRTGFGAAATTGRPAPPDPRAARGPTKGRIVRATVQVDPRHPPVVRAGVGDLIELNVGLRGPSTLALGDERIESGDEDTPARFDFIADRAGSYGIRRLEDGATVARLVVSPAG